jgi:hypothetical protein
MEAHKPHHPTHKKKWAEYLLEFLMLFIAVFLGFLAEYQLEHKIEREKEYEYMISMAEDLKQDIPKIQFTIDGLRTQIRGKDTLVQLINNGITTPQQHKEFYDLHWRYVGFYKVVAFSKRTLLQLLNSGGLRLIRNMNVSDGISNYASVSTQIETVDLPSSIWSSNKAMEDSKKLIDIKYMRAEPGDELVRAPATNPIVRNVTPDVLKDFSFSLEIDKESCILKVHLLKEHQKLAGELLELIKKEYKLE